jgi:alkylation response protein AidB-like acyl-CoA dehydrogenase
MQVPGAFILFATPPEDPISNVGLSFTQKGLTVILVERQEGVETKPIPTSYSPTAGTSFVTFENVKVPVENTLGGEGRGIFVILRWADCSPYSFHLTVYPFLF